MQDWIAKAATLLEALPYIQKFSGATFVIKYGGSFMDSPDPGIRNGAARDIVFLEAVEINPVVVHGGGKAITRAMEAAGLKASFIQGQRVTDQATVNVVDQVLSREINPEIVKMIIEHGGREFSMAEPLLFFIAPHGQPPKPVASVDKQQVDEWSEETELRDGGGALRRDGRNGVDVVSATDRNGAAQPLGKIRAAGYPARVEVTRDGYGSEDHYVRITGLATPGDAAALAEKLKSLGFAEARAR